MENGKHTQTVSMGPAPSYKNNPYVFFKFFIFLPTSTHLFIYFLFSDYVFKANSGNHVFSNLNILLYISKYCSFIFLNWMWLVIIAIDHCLVSLLQYIRTPDLFYFIFTYSSLYEKPSHLSYRISPFLNLANCSFLMR